MKTMKKEVAGTVIFVMMLFFMTALGSSAAGFNQVVSQNMTFNPSSNLLREKDNMMMMYVPAGEFTMGSKEGNDDEKPVHLVYLDTYWIDQTEVTNGQYEKCVMESVCTQPGSVNSDTRVSYFGNNEFMDYPVMKVVWDQANTYCQWAGGRLPTEAEWEKAARGTDQRTYPWGNSVDSNLANYDVNIGDTTKVGSYPAGASPYGVLDMAGNVWEWVSDWSANDYYKSSPNQNPTGPASGENRMARGGSWNDSASVIRSDYRYRYNPSDSASYLGFRCVFSETANLPASFIIPVKLATVTSPTVTSATVGDIANWVDQSIADGTHYAAGQTGDFTWYVTNIGTTTWTTDYSLRFYSGTNFAKDGNTRYHLPAAIAPKETAAVTISIVAPTTAGEYKMSWVLSNPNDENFYLIYFAIVVD